MSEDRAEYRIDGVDLTLKELASRSCSRRFDDPQYRPPTPLEIDGLIKLAGWSQREAALVVGANFTPGKGSTTIRKWRAKEGAPEHRVIPYAAWRLMLLEAGVVVLEKENRATLQSAASGD